MASRETVRQALIQRVSRKVSGHGVTRRSVEGAVDRVLAALPAELARPQGTARVAVFSATSAPDLASRLRRLLERDGVALVDVGSATAGRHTVVSLRTTGASEATLQHVATELGASLSLLSDADAGQVGR